MKSYRERPEFQEQRRGYKRKHKYGITTEDFDRLFDSQGQRCAICKTADPGTRTWCVDHDHITNQVRGILCYNCNILLGHAKDDVTILESAVEYLKGVLVG